MKPIINMSFLIKYKENIMPTNDLTNKNNYIDIPENIYFILNMILKMVKKQGKLKILLLALMSKK